MAKTVLPYMIKQQYGHIVTMSSPVGYFGFPLRSAYSAAKHALHGFYETLRIEHQQDNIKVSIVTPGRVNTNISINAITQSGKKHGKMDDGQANAMSSEKFAKKMIKALAKDKKEILIGGKELIMIYLKRFFPFIFNNIVRKIKPT
jgi:short-subunit dehydrogenase